MRLLFCLLFFMIAVEAKPASFSLRDKFKSSKAGDYIVTQQDKNYSILLVKEKRERAVVFEEITFPETAINPEKQSWQDFLKQNAPSHSSWLLFELSLDDGSVIECYSILQRSWISFSDSEHFLSQFFCLPLTETPLTDRRRVGPPPGSSDLDRRSFWYPPLIVQGQKKKNAAFDVRRAKWAADGSLIASSTIEMFFNSEDTAYPFPIWIEVNNGHYGFKIRAFDTGRGLISPFQREMPRRPPLVAGIFSVLKDTVELPIKCPVYAKSFIVSAIDVSDPFFPRFEVRHELIPTDKKELFLVKLSKKELYKVLQKGHRYRLSLTPATPSSFFIETEESFLLP